MEPPDDPQHATPPEDPADLGGRTWERLGDSPDAPQGLWSPACCAPRCASHRPVSRPRPPVPPDSRWAPRGGVGAVFGMRTTTLPRLAPLCNSQSAACTARSAASSRLECSSLTTTCPPERRAASSCESLARAAVISRAIAVADSSIGEGKDAAPARPSAKMNLSVW